MRKFPGDLQVREAADRDILTRGISVRAQTVNEQQRSVEAVFSTDAPVTVYDWKRGETIDEVLLAEGAQLPAQIPLLATHDRWSLESLLGSGRGLRAEGGQVVGSLFFARDDKAAEAAWNKVRQGHITDVSIGYRVIESTEIQPGQTATIAGRTFTARRRVLRVATRWVPKEVSLVPIGADPAAKMREETPFSQGNTMDKKLRAYLETIGLRSAADEAEAKAFYDALSASARATADEAAADKPADEAAAKKAAEDKVRADEAAAKKAAGGSDNNPPATPEEGRQAGIQAERDRVRSITALADDDVPPVLLSRALAEGWDETRATREFLGAVRDARRLGADIENGPGRAPAGHVRGEGDSNARSLAAGMLIGAGLDPTKHVMHNGRMEPGRRDALSEQDADTGDRFRNLSGPDLFRECLRIDTGRSYPTIEEALDAARAAPSGGTLSYVFSTNIYAKLIQGWERVGDTTVGWCDEEDVANFLQQEDISITAQARLEKLGPGDTAKDATIADKHETYKIARFAKKFTVDEIDVINDRLGAIMRMPMELGVAARALRPDLVYSLMLTNPTLVADGYAVFKVAHHVNLGTGVLSSANLKLGITAVSKQRENNRVLNIRPKFLIVPAALDWTGRELTQAAALAKLFADSSDPMYAQLNLLAQEGLRVVMDDRIGAAGVIDPHTGSTRTGTDTNWFLAAGGSKSIRVAYRRGTGRQPVMRSFVLDKGQWGMGWDINMDIAAAFMDYRPWYKSAGTA